VEVLTKRKLLVDAAIAGAFVAAAELEAALGLATRGSWTHALFAPLFLAPLAVRRRIPPLAFVSAVAGLVVLDADAALSLFGAVVLASYSVGAAVEGRLAYLVPATAVALFAALATGGEAAPSDIVALGLFFGGPWWVGRLVRQRVRQADELVLLAERERETASAVAEERGRIARELHDIVSHAISVVTVQTQAVRWRLPPELAREADDLCGVEATAREAMAEMRRLFGVLRADESPASLAPQPRPRPARPSRRAGARLRPARPGDRRGHPGGAAPWRRPRGVSDPPEGADERRPARALGSGARPAPIRGHRARDLGRG